MNIICTFPFSEAYELNILLLKFNLENKWVSEWIIAENDYTFMGQYKGFNLKRLLNEDVRFIQFRDKITVIEKSINLKLSGKEGDFSIGDNQRNSVKDYIINRHPDGTRVIVSDIDQAYDFEGGLRTELMLDFLTQYKDQAISFPIMKFWYDIDNFGHYLRQHCIKPIEHIKKKGGFVYAEYPGARFNALDYKLNQFTIFEYTFCYFKEEIMRKLDTYGHFPFNEYDLDIALKCNHWIRRSQIGDVCPPPSEEHNPWFETLELNYGNASQYILENFDSLKTKNVDPNYKENRKEYYPQYFRRN